MTTALLVIDVQEEYFSGLLPIEYPPREESLARIGQAMDAATAGGVPVVVVRHNDGPFDTFRPGTPTWALHPEIAGRHHDHLIDKTLPGSFTGTDLYAWLADRGVDHVTVAGYMTNVCCDTTVRQAIHEGWGATLLHDATGVPALPGVDGEVLAAPGLHRAALAPLALMGARVTATTTWTTELTPSTGHR